MQGLAKYVSSSPDLDRNFSMAFEPCPGIHHSISLCQIQNYNAYCYTLR